MMVILFLVAELVIQRSDVRASDEILAIQKEINTIKADIDTYNSSISGHQIQYKNAIKEKEYCIAQCEFSWNSQANMEHSGANNDRIEISRLQTRLSSLENRLGLLMERQLQ
jgi:hypothetical protein